MVGGRRGDMPPRRYRDTTFNDDFDFIPARGGSSRGRPRPPLDDRGVRGPAASGPRPLSLDPAWRPGAPSSPNAISSRSLASAVRSNNVATAIDRRIVNATKTRGTSQVLRTGAAPAISGPWRAAVNRVAKQHARGQTVHAKEISADRRFNNFSTYPKNVNGTYARITPTLRGKLRFVSPQFVFPCVQRTTRRECLFAFKKAGRAGHHQRRRRRSPHSNIGC